MREDSRVYNLLKRYGTYVYHIYLFVDNIYSEVKKFKNAGYLIIEPPSLAIAFNEKNVAFLFSKNLGIVEFI